MRTSTTVQTPARGGTAITESAVGGSCLVRVRGLSLSIGGRELLDGADLDILAGECVALTGPSGVGKTTLLNCVAGIVAPSEDSVFIMGRETSNDPTRQRSEFRLRHLGMVFQFGELIPELTARENVAFPSRLLGVDRDEAEQRALSWLERLGVGGCAHQHPAALSGGQVQRVGIARALAHSPSLILADEPTGMLDEESSEAVARILREVTQEVGVAVLIATHDPRLAALADRTVSLQRRALVPR